MQNYKLGEYIRQRRLDLKTENRLPAEIESMRFYSALVCRMTGIMRW